DPGAALIHWALMMGVVETFASGPLVKSTLPTIVVVLSVLSAFRTLALFFGSELAFSVSKPASSSDMEAPSCCVHCLLAAFSYPSASSTPVTPVNGDLYGNVLCQ